MEKTVLAIYHLSVKTISRSAGRSATAAAAYRSGVKIEDEAAGEIHDYRRKGAGVESATLVLPKDAPAWANDRSKLWNAAEAAEKRKNSTVAREVVIALPSELTGEQRKALALEFARQLVEHHQCAADVGIHKPDADGDNRNHHAHILLTTRRLEATGFTEKTRELDEKRNGSEAVKEWRRQFAMLQNAHLREAGHSARVDHRTLAEQGIDRIPTKHLGVNATAVERKTGQPSRRRITHNEEASKRLALAKSIGDAERSIGGLQSELIDLKTTLAQVQAEQEKKSRREKLDELMGMKEGMAAARKSFLQWKQQKAVEAAAEQARQVEMQRQEQARREAIERQLEEVKRMAELQAARMAERERREAEAERKRSRDNDRGMSM